MKSNSKQRLFEVMQRLDKTFKPNLNETWTDGTNYSVEDNMPSIGEYIENRLPTITAIGKEDPTGNLQWNSVPFKDVSFKEKKDGYYYFYWSGGGMSHDEEGQTSYSEPNDKIIEIPAMAIKGIGEPNVLIVKNDEYNNIKLI